MRFFCLSEYGCPEDFLDSFIGSAKLLRETATPHDVIIFDQPTLWEAPKQLERLSSYDTIILPLIDAISQSQRTRLAEVLDAGTSVLATAPLPTRSDTYRETTTAQQLLKNHSDARVLEADSAGRYKRGESDGGAFRTALEDTHTPQVRIDTDDLIGVNVLEQSSAGRKIIHLINYEYELASDEVRPLQDLTIRIYDIDLDINAARYYTTETATDLEITDTSDGIELTIPNLDIWGFVVFATGLDAIESGNRQSAERAVDTATSAVNEAIATNRAKGFATAQNELENARRALQYGAYEQANRMAEKAESAATKAHQPPTVGIDTGHGQAKSGTGMTALNASLQRYDRYNYENVTAWSADSLSSIDLLIIPPAYRFKEAEYGFTIEELEVIEQFVSDGGNLLILARGGAAEGLSDLAALYGFDLDPTTSIRTDEDFVRAATALHPLTKMSPRLSVRFATPIKSMPESATTLASMRTDTASYLQGPNVENSPSAAGEPVYAHQAYGNGQVAVLGTPSPFTDPIDNLHIARNALKELSHGIGQTESGPSSTDTATSKPTSASTPTEQARLNSTKDSDMTPASGPGFGFGAALGGASTLAAYLKYRYITTDNK